MEEGVFPSCPTWFSSNIMACSDNGTTVAYGSYHKILILDFNNGKLPTMRSIVQNNESKVTSVAFSPVNSTTEGYLAASCDDGFVRIWDLKTLTLFKEHSCHLDNEENGCKVKVCCLDWSYFDTQSVCSVGEDGSLVVWEVYADRIKYNIHRKLDPNVLSCCPLKPLVAVGCKKGLVWIINTSKDQLLYRLRGHEFEITSLSWCPSGVNIFKLNKVCQDVLLASAGKDKTIFIWRAGSDGSCEVNLTMPQNMANISLQKAKSPKTVFVGVFWLSPYVLLQSNEFGELSKWNLESMAEYKFMNKTKNLKQSKYYELVHREHQRNMLSLCGKQYSGSIVNCNVDENSENDEIVSKKWTLTLSDEEQLVYSISQDNIFVCYDYAKQKVIKKFSTFTGAVSCYSVSPHDPNLIALGCADGKIRLWNLSDENWTFKIFWQRILDKVVCVSWHPTREMYLAYGTTEGRIGLIFVDSNKPPCIIRSRHKKKVFNLSFAPPCWPEEKERFAADESLVLYSCGDGDIIQNSVTKSSDEWVNLRDFVQFPSKMQTDFKWKDDFSLLLVGNSDGSINLLKPPHLKMLHTVMAYKKYIQFLSWHPLSTTADTGVSPYHNYFTASSYDPTNEVKVFKCEETDVLTEDYNIVQVTTLSGHMASVHHVTWSPHVSCQLLTTSRDCSTQVWDVLNQKPIANYYASPTSFFNFSLWSPIDLDAVISGSQDSCLYVWRVSSQTRVLPDSFVKRNKTSKGKKCKKSVVQKVKAEENKQKKNNKNDESKPTSSVIEYDKNFKLLLKSAKLKPIQPVNNCYKLLSEDKIDEARDILDVNNDEDKDYVCVGLRMLDDVEKFISIEQENHREVEDCTSECVLALWQGNIKEVIEERIQTGARLSDEIVAMSTSVSPRLWKEACHAYAQQLITNKYYTKAASYLVACHKIDEAVNVLTDGGFFKEALCLIKARMPSDEVMLKHVLKQYAHKHVQCGMFCHAAESFIYMGEYKSAAQNLSLGKSEHHLRCAALAAKKAGDMIHSLECLTESLQMCLVRKNWELAKGLCYDHAEFKHLLLWYTCYKKLCELADENVSTPQDLLNIILPTIQDDLQLEECYKFLNSFYDKSAVYKNKYKLLICVSKELSAALCSSNINQQLTHIIRILNSCDHYFGEESLLYNMCVWLSNSEQFLSRDNIYSVGGGEKCSEKVRSIRAFLCKALVDKQPTNLSVDQLLSILDQIIDDALHKDNIAYYQHQIQFKKLEREQADCVLKRQNKNKVNVCAKSENVEIGSDGVQDSVNSEASYIASDQAPVNDQESICSNGVQDSVSNQSTLDIDSCGVQDSINGIASIDMNSNEDAPEEKEVDKCLIVQMNKLKEFMDTFEQTSISTPHPATCYCKLKEICYKFTSTSDKPDIVLSKTEQLWRTGSIP